MMRKLLEAMTKFANPEQKPGEQWKGTDKGTPGNKLVGSADESVLKDLSKGQTPKTKEEELAEAFANFNEDDLGVEEKRPQRKGSRADKVGVRGHKEQPRYTTVKAEVEETTAAKLKVGDHITANTSKGEYPGGHKSRAGKVTRVGQTGVHIRPDDGGEVEYHPYKIVKKTVKDKDVYEGWNNGTDRVQLADSTSAYWDGSGRLQAEYDELYKQLVPASGAAETLEGEVIRASSKIVYRHFNDGDEFNKASFDQLKPFIGSVTSYDDLAEKAIEFALKAQGNYHPNAGWDSLDVMDYGPSEEEEYDDEEDDDSWDHDDDEDLLGEGEHDAEFIDHEDNWYNMADWARAEFKKGKSVEEVIKYLRDNDYLGPQDTNNFMKTVRGEKWNESVEEAGGPPKAALAFAKKADRATALHHFKKGMANDDLSKFTQAQSQIDVDRENERDRFSQEELYPADDSHDLDEAMNDEGWDEKHRQETLPGMDTPYQSVAHQTLNQAAKVKPLTRTTTGNIVVNASVTPQANGDLLVKGTTTDASVTPNRKNVWVLTINANQQIKNKHVGRLNDAELEAVVFNLGTNGILRNKQVNPLKEADTKLVARAHAIIRKHGDADMGHSEFMQLLTSNGIPEKVAHHVASDYRPVSEGWGADTQKAESDRSSAAWDTLRAKYANDPAVIKRLNYLERMNWTAAAAEKKANAGEIKGINEDVTSTDPLEGALLNAIQELVSQGHKDVDPMVLTNMVVAATSRPFLLKDLVDANNNSLAVQHYIDSISPSKVKFSTDTLTVKNEDPNKDKAKARAGVSSMASRAANRSRLGENTINGPHGMLNVEKKNGVTTVTRQGWDSSSDHRALATGGKYFPNKDMHGQSGGNSVKTGSGVDYAAGTSRKIPHQDLDYTERDLDETKGLHTKVKIVKGSDAGKTGWVRQIKTDKLRNRVYLDIDLEDGGQSVVLKQDVRLVKDVTEAVSPGVDTVASIKKLWQYIGRNLDHLASMSAYYEENYQKPYIEDRLNTLLTTADGQPITIGFDDGGKIEVENGVLYIPVGTMWRFRGMFTGQQFVQQVTAALGISTIKEATDTRKFAQPAPAEKEAPAVDKAATDKMFNYTGKNAKVKDFVRTSKAANPHTSNDTEAALGHMADMEVRQNDALASSQRVNDRQEIAIANLNKAVNQSQKNYSAQEKRFQALTAKIRDQGGVATARQVQQANMAAELEKRNQAQHPAHQIEESIDSPLRDKEDYTAKRKALQDIQLDPDTAKDPQLKAELARRLGSLNQQYTDLQSKLREFKESRGHKVIATKLGNMDRMNNVKVPSPAERREQLRIAKAKEEAGKQQVKEFAAPGANPAPVVAPANDPAAKQQAQKIATATNTIKSATGSTVAAPVLATALDAASQGQANPAQVKAIAPIANVVDAATKDPKLAGQFKTLATQAQQSLKAQQKPQ